MSENAITISNISKLYHIGHVRSSQTFRDAIMSLMRNLAARVRPGHASETRLEDFWALKDININVKRGEVVGLVGRNGAGKSTLLKVISRITAPTTGRITLNGRVASLLEVGTGFHPELTGRENIYLNGAILGMRKGEIRRKFDEIVAFSEVERFLDTPVKYYSSGMYVRLAFSVAAHLEPEILIVDEVLAVGDADFQRKCLGKMGSVASSGRTILFVSHNMSAIRSLCSHGVLLSGGRCVADGSIASVLAEYLRLNASTRTTYVAPESQAKGPHVVRASVSTSSPTGSHDLNCPLDFEFTLNTAGKRKLSLGLHIYDSKMNQVVHSSNEFGEETARQKADLTTYKVRIPPHVLNVGDYRCSLNLSERNVTTHQVLDSALVFGIEDLSFAIPGTQPAEWQGACSPRIVEWTLLS